MKNLLQIALLQKNQTALRDELQQTVKPDERLAEQILNMGFDIELIRDALKNSSNDMQRAIDSLLKMQADGTYPDALKKVLESVNIDPNAPSTSSSTSQLLSQIHQNHAEEMDVSINKSNDGFFFSHFQDN